MQRAVWLCLFSSALIFTQSAWSEEAVKNEEAVKTEPAPAAALRGPVREKVALKAAPSPHGKPSKLLPAAKLVPSSKAPSEVVLSDEQRDFTRAADLIKAGKESEAFISLSDVLRRYPSSQVAPEAQYMLGELLFKQRKYQEAAGEFSKVYKYGTLGVEKAPWASIKIGECWYQLKMYDRARIEWEAVRRKFPNSEASDAAHSRLAGVPL